MSFYRKLKFILVLIGLACLSLSVSAQSPKENKLSKKVIKKLGNASSVFEEWQHLGSITIDSISILEDQKLIQLFLSTPASYIPIREDNLQIFKNEIKSQLGKKFEKYSIQLISDGHQFEALIPNYYRSNINIDSNRISPDPNKTVPLIRKIDSNSSLYGLNENHIALWHSHGRYYDAKLDRWEWQRARLHTTVEDIFPLTFVLPYLAPMLENAGATVFLPRERDIQRNEVIVDNNGSTSSSEILISGLKSDTITTSGFAIKDTLKSVENPFLLGSYLEFLI